MAKKRPKPFKSLINGSTHSDFPTMFDAGCYAAMNGTGELFYERGFFGIVWFEEPGVRHVRDLKRWSSEGSTGVPRCV